MGQPISAISSPDVVQYYLVFGFLLINFSPGDVAFKMLTTPKHPLRLAMLFVESVDDATTIFGAFEKGASLHPQSPAAPYVSALAAVLGGGIARYFERKGRGRDVKTEWSKPTGRIQTGMAYIFIYAALRRIQVEKRTAQLWFTLFDCAVTLADEIRPGGFENPILTLWKAMAAYFKRLPVLECKKASTRGEDVEPKALTTGAGPGHEGGSGGGEEHDASEETAAAPPPFLRA
ncbi:unnamed protein product [Polarella glacialis]|uniref:Uncharacterized protein n=1 Tax=Polarella glacialis TaxID=89957 RepID=A0A813EBM5_POLGL|nr:unnamed protein product [Polarella glacialis]